MADNPTEAADALATAAAAVSGPGTPDKATVTSAPVKGVPFALIAAGPAVSVMLILLVVNLSFHHWPDVMHAGPRGWWLAGKILDALTLVSAILAGLLGLIVFRLASGGLKSVKAQALSGSIEVKTGDD